MKKALILLSALFVIVCAVSLVKKDAFAETLGDYEYTVENGEAKIDYYTGTDSVLEIPSKLGGYPVTALGTYAMNYSETITSVTVPDSVKSFGYGVFYDCPNLKSVTLPDDLEELGDSTFTQCYNLTSVKLPKNLKSIGDDVFASDSSLTSITIPDKVTTIGEYAFAASGIQNITIPDSVTSISEYAFAYCSKLTSITISDSVTSISDNLFCDCGALKSVKLGKKVKSIGYLAFYNCGALEEIEFSDGLESIGQYAFQDCVGLKSITIPDSVQLITDNAFYECSALKSVTIGSGVTAMSGAFYGVENLEEVIIKDGVTCLTTFIFDDAADSFTITASCDLTVINDIIGETKRKWNKVHKFDEGTVTIEATCTKEGDKLYTCEGCGLTEHKPYMLPHDMTEFAAKTPTCTQAGNILYYYCNNCKQYFSDKDGTKALASAADAIIPALGHHMSEIKEKKATCTEPGNNAYYFCDRCNSYFKDITGVLVTAPSAEVIAASGHVFGYKGDKCSICGITFSEYVETLKIDNPMKLKGKTVKLKAADVAKKKQVIALKKAIKVSKAKGNVTYKKAKGDSAITINKKTGKITVKKGLKKGTYKVTIKVTAAGNDSFKPVTKKVKVTVKIYSFSN